MAEESKSAKQEVKEKLPRWRSEFLWFGLMGLLLLGFFAWVLMQMGGQSAGGTLARMLIGIAVVLLGGGLLAWALGRTRKTPFHEDK
jgi:thiol:disulfide interchange protein